MCAVLQKPNLVMAALLVIALVLKYAEEKEESVQRLEIPSADPSDSFCAFFQPIHNPHPHL